MPVRRRLVVAITPVLVVLAGGVAWAFWPSSEAETTGASASPSSPTSPTSTTSSPTAGTTASPAGTSSPDDVPGEDAAGIDGEQNEPGGATDGPAVTITVATLGPDGTTVDVSGYVDALGQGTCTATVTVGTSRSSSSGPTYPDATSASCGTLSVPVTDLPAGSATVTLSYTATGLSASSTPTSLDLP